MIVRNWMKRNPTTVTSDTLVAKAKRMLLESNLRALPVVDDGRLRGLFTRVGCLRAAEAVARTEDPYEFDYFVNRLKVKDLMVCNPQTVTVDDTMEHCLRLGQDKKVGQFPVLEDGNVVGVVSAAEVFFLAAEVLGAWRRCDGISVGPLPIENGTLGKITKIVEDGVPGVVLESVFAVRMNETDDRTKVVLRFSGAAAEQVASVVHAAGLNVLEVCPSAVPESAAD